MSRAAVSATSAFADETGAVSAPPDAGEFTAGVGDAPPPTTWGDGVAGAVSTGGFGANCV
jgi:hypothetical protein